MCDFPKPPALDEDADVAGERARIGLNGKTNDILRIRDLSKVKPFSFPNMGLKGKQKRKKHSNLSDCQTYKGTLIPAVNRICVGVSPGEVCLAKVG